MKQDLLQLINYVDSNKDFLITLEEFVAAFEKEIDPEILIKQFFSLDTNKDGVISYRDDVNPDGIIDKKDLEFFKSVQRKNEGYGQIEQICQRLIPLVKDEIDYLSKKKDFLIKSRTEFELNKRLKLYSYSVPITNLPSEFEGFTILHLSDLHFGEKNKSKISKISKIKQIIQQINETIDLVVYTGDIIDNKDSMLDDNIRNTLKQIPGEEKYFVLGNHDYLKDNGSYVKSFLESVNIINLTNKKITIERKKKKLNLFGIDDNLKGNSITPNIDGNTRFETNLMITHNLDVLRNNYPGCIDLILSGHLHSGEIDLKLFSGIDYLTFKKAYENLNNQKTGWKLLTRRTSSYISPGLQTRYFRLNTEQEGFSILKLKKY
jgi:predicted MPP superfamily phosphohydrolase